jgi:hypothetical protein
MTLANKDFNLQGAPSPTSKDPPPSNFLGPFPHFLYFFLKFIFLNFVLFF